MLSNNSVNSTHYVQLIDAEEIASDSSVDSVDNIRTSIIRGKAKVYYFVKAFDSKEEALSFLVNEVYENGRNVWRNKTGIFQRHSITIVRKSYKKFEFKELIAQDRQNLI